MGMLGACIDEKLLDHLAAQPVLRQHALHGALDDGFWTALQQVLGDFLAQTTGVAGEVLVDLLLEFVAGELDLVGIDENDVISAINVGRVVSFVLTAQNGGDLATHATYSLIGPVHNIPVVRNGSCISMLGGEM